MIPVIRHYGRPWFARTTFGVLEGGVRTELVSGLAVGAQLAYESGRDRSESSFLAAHSLPNLPASVSWGVHAELEKNIGPMPLIALLRYRQDMDGQRGAQADVRLTAGLYSGHGLSVGVFVQTTWADAPASQYYYGISPQAAASSGLAAYQAQAGALFNSEGLLWSYELTPKWMLLGAFESRQLRGDALNSSLVQQSANRYASLSLAYQF
jgi:outer membrane scaffolding protein for murein synthesis (MipA/OmpV family)